MGDSAKQSGGHMCVSDQLSGYKMPTLTRVWQVASSSASVIGSASGDIDVTRGAHAHLLLCEAPPLRVYYCWCQLQDSLFSTRQHIVYTTMFFLHTTCWKGIEQKSGLRLSTVVFCRYTVYRIKFSCCLAVCRLVNVKICCLRCGCWRR